MPLKINSQKVESVVAICKLDESDKIGFHCGDGGLVISRNESIFSGGGRGRDIVAISREDAISLAKAILSMMEEE